MLAGRFSCMVTDSKRKWLSSGSKVTFWRPFCLCKLGSQDLKILLGNRIFWIQHTQIRLKSLVPNFYSKMLLTFTFPRNPTRLYHLMISSVMSQKGVMTIQRYSVENQKGIITIQRYYVENQKGVITIQRYSVENQKGIITIQRYPVENQKGVITVQRYSVENQKGIITIQRYSVENQKGAFAVQSLWRQCPSGSQWNIVDQH